MPYKFGEDSNFQVSQSEPSAIATGIAAHPNYLTEQSSTPTNAVPFASVKKWKVKGKKSQSTLTAIISRAVHCPPVSLLFSFLSLNSSSTVIQADAPVVIKCLWSHLIFSLTLMPIFDNALESENEAIHDIFSGLGFTGRGIICQRWVVLCATKTEK
ncbi:hypothetical protein PILCRDRAFT_91111 [Piloderma croceum F 1598]|uniref:Uncharacterized protein n=1 Tax=Piloderma croceum (strain F 1598) TaxID=765440 RepID=A0A0C3FCI2_PILCF|nr:hypothetical protein PILCRDRAFT_91111 [Piloderma croceum F 1598]